jgi:hypothetical protein
VGTSILAACLFHLAQTTDGSCPIEPTKPERHAAATRRLTETAAATNINPRRRTARPQDRWTALDRRYIRMIHGRRRMRPGKGDSSDDGFVGRILGGGSEAAKAVSFAPSNWKARWLAHPG